MTYPAVHGMDAARSMVRNLTQEATDALGLHSRNTTALRSIAEYLMNREY